MRSPLLALFLIVLAVTCAAAEGLGKYRTPDGKLYFGSAPPKGSVPVDDVRPKPPAAPSKPTTTKSKPPAAKSRTASKPAPPPPARRSTPVPEGSPAITVSQGPTIRNLENGFKRVDFCFRSAYREPRRVWATLGDRWHNFGMIRPNGTECVSVDVPVVTAGDLRLEACVPQQEAGCERR